MEFHVETAYTHKTLTAMAHALRKTLRKRRSRMVHIFGWILIALLVLMLIPTKNNPFVLDFSTVVNGVLLLILLVTLLFEDQLNGLVARKRMLKGMEKAKAAFTEENFLSVTGAGETRWNYSAITAMAETQGYFIFMLNKHLGQAYDLSNLSGGTVEEFRTFLQEKTGKPIQVVK